MGVGAMGWGWGLYMGLYLPLGDAEEQPWLRTSPSEGVCLLTSVSGKGPQSELVTPNPKA